MNQSAELVETLQGDGALIGETRKLHSEDLKSALVKSDRYLRRVQSAGSRERRSMRLAVFLFTCVVVFICSRRLRLHMILPLLQQVPPQLNLSYYRGMLTQDTALMNETLPLLEETHVNFSHQVGEGSIFKEVEPSGQGDTILVTQMNPDDVSIPSAVALPDGSYTKDISSSKERIDEREEDVAGEKDEVVTSQDGNCFIENAVNSVEGKREGRTGGDFCGFDSKESEATLPLELSESAEEPHSVHDETGLVPGAQGENLDESEDSTVIIAAHARESSSIIEDVFPSFSAHEDPPSQHLLEQMPSKMGDEL